MDELKAFLKEYKWRVIGIIAGIVLTVLMFSIGFWRTLLLIAIVAACYIVGKKLDNGGMDGLDEIIAGLFRKK